MNRRKEIKDQASKDGIKILTARTREDCSRAGIHVMGLKTSDLIDGIDRAKRKGYRLVICHKERTWPYKVTV